MPPEISNLSNWSDLSVLREKLKRLHQNINTAKALALLTFKPLEGTRMPSNRPHPTRMGAFFAQVLVSLRLNCQASVSSDAHENQMKAFKILRIQTSRKEPA